jgi:uncharacterized membrane protein YbhN (UPF0104 family)
VAAFLAGLTVALASAGRRVPWGDVGAVLRGYDTGTLLIAGALTTASYAVYTMFDLLSRRHLALALPRRRVVAIAVVSYASNLNLGAIIGAAGLRYRLYSRSGLSGGAISRLVAFSVTTNWLGYAALAGAVFASGAVVLPRDAGIGTATLRGVGAGMVALAAVYLAVCTSHAGREVAFQQIRLTLPSGSTALIQLGLATVNWLLIGLTIHTLLPADLSFWRVLGVHCLSAVASVIMHVPAGAGVIEGTYILLLGGAAPTAELVAAVLAFRAVYYLAPLLVALGLLLALEMRGRH